MTLAEIEVGELDRALRKERSKWIDVAREENRRHAEPEKVTISLLAALEHVLDMIPPSKPMT
jgi:hypothetical protein